MDHDLPFVSWIIYPDSVPHCLTTWMYPLWGTKINLCVNVARIRIYFLLFVFRISYIYISFITTNIESLWTPDVRGVANVCAYDYNILYHNSDVCRESRTRGHGQGIVCRTSYSVFCSCGSQQASNRCRQMRACACTHIILCTLYLLAHKLETDVHVHGSCDKMASAKLACVSLACARLACSRLALLTIE